jgi:hypothetical protein
MCVHVQYLLRKFIIDKVVLGIAMAPLLPGLEPVLHDVLLKELPLAEVVCNVPVLAAKPVRHGLRDSHTLGWSPLESIDPLFAQDFV